MYLSIYLFITSIVRKNGEKYIGEQKKCNNTFLESCGLRNFDLVL